MVARDNGDVRVAIMAVVAEDNSGRQQQQRQTVMVADNDGNGKQGHARSGSGLRGEGQE